MNDAPRPDPNELEQTLRASRRLEDAPETLIQRAIDLWQPRAGSAAGAGGPLQRWRATLRFDSATTGHAALGLRSSGAAVTRQMLFSCEGRDIDLRLDPLPDGQWRISGQVLGPDAAGIAELRCGDAPPQRVAWSELAEFEFEPVPADICVLVLRSDGWELDVPSFDLARKG
jgi:hypothetical protein